MAVRAQRWNAILKSVVSAVGANRSFQGTAGKQRLPVRSGLRPPLAPELKRWVSHTVTTRLAFGIAYGYPFGYTVMHEHL